MWSFLRLALVFGLTVALNLGCVTHSNKGGGADVDKVVWEKSDRIPASFRLPGRGIRKVLISTADSPLELSSAEGISLYASSKADLAEVPLMTKGDKVMATLVAGEKYLLFPPSSRKLFCGMRQLRKIKPELFNPGLCPWIQCLPYMTLGDALAKFGTGEEFFSGVPRDFDISRMGGVCDCPPLTDSDFEPVLCDDDDPEKPVCPECCKICQRGKACGDSCIARDLTCHQETGCACDSGR